MAEKKAGGYKRSGKQLRYLFASGVLGHAAGSKGKPGKTTYSKAKSQGLKGKAPAKADYSGTRASRIAAGRAVFTPGSSAKREATRLKAAAHQDTPAFGPSQSRAAVAIRGMSERRLSGRIELANRQRQRVTDDLHSLSGRQLVAKLGAARAAYNGKKKKRAGVEALISKYGVDGAARIVQKYSGRTIREARSR